MSDELEDVLIDDETPLPDQPTLGESEMARSPWRRRLLFGALALAFLLLAGAGATAGYLAFTNKDRADRWQTRANELDQDVGELEDAVLELTDDLNDRTDQLNTMADKVLDAERAITRSEADVRSLERRQRQLANEKAQVEDARAALAVQTDAIEDVANAFIVCKDGLVELLGYVVSQNYVAVDAAYPGVDGDCQMAENELAGYLGRHGR